MRVGAARGRYLPRLPLRATTTTAPAVHRQLPRHCRTPPHTHHAGKRGPENVWGSAAAGTLCALGSLKWPQYATLLKVRLGFGLISLGC